MTDNELRRWMQEQAAYNEAFRGKSIDPDKLRRLNKLNALAEKLRDKVILELPRPLERRLDSHFAT